MEGASQSVPGFGRKAIERRLDCGDPEKGFIRLRCPDCQVERALAFSCKGRGLCPSCGARRMHDTAEHLVERVLPEVAIRPYVLSPPSELVGLLAARGEALSALGRIFIDSIFQGIRSRNASGNLHCGAVVFVQHVSRPPFSEGQLRVLDEERVELSFRSPLGSGQKALILHPLSLMKRLAWLVPPPGQHQVRYVGVLGPNARLRPQVVPMGRIAVQGCWFGPRKYEASEPVSYRMGWARLLSKVYDVDGHACPRCPGTLRAVGAVLFPEASACLSSGGIDVLSGTDPPPPKHLSLGL